MAKREHIAYINIDGITVGVTTSTHCHHRASSTDSDRFCYDGDFVIGRIATLLGREDFVDVLLNGIRMGETFIIQDVDMGMDIVVGYAYDKVDCMDMLTAITTRRKLRIGHGQKVIRVLTEAIKFGTWNNEAKRMEVKSV